MDTPKTETSKAELIKELSTVVRQQIHGEMDWVRARTYWQKRLPTLDPELLAEALSYVLDRAAISGIK
ncbi:hypothetical protein [Salmonella enterica]|uniref:hypothetical protein n=1 Tax=Salmonella enterica TaxID=28901 RepID=UPI0021D4CDC9|nr:hypothetical protein [Salmonella enterica]MCU7097901.1 hypothetical protein [Salmonella enterica]MCU7116306.1 hypothetical protein [Salmonella enterica]MCU7123661.1 hypothetical protein [Salmonella enterica]